jgi:hypothetical protein
MCLIPDTKNCLIAEEDITVYKYASMRLRVKEGNYNGRLVHPEEVAMNKRHWIDTEFESVWISPFMNKCPVIYTEGETINEPMFKGENLCEVNLGLHSYAVFEDAMSRADVFKFADGATAVLECVIPKGTRYWKSVRSPHDDQYCSESLRVKKVVYTQCTATVADSGFAPEKVIPGMPESM